MIARLLSWWKKDEPNKKISDVEYLILEAIQTFEKDVYKIQSHNIDNIDPSWLLEYSDSKLTILHCHYYKQYLSGIMNNHIGKWIYLVGDGIWDNETFNCKEEAENQAKTKVINDFSKVIFTVCINDKSSVMEDINAFIYYYLSYVYNGND
jgi:hypothetical protein